MLVRGVRGVDRVGAALGVADARDGAALISSCRALGSTELGLPLVPIVVAARASRARPAARGRHVAGVITLYPRAFADPLTLAFTLLHEIGHAAGFDEERADAFASRMLFSPDGPADI